MAGEGDARSSAELAVKHVSWSKAVCAVAAVGGLLVATAEEDRLNISPWPGEIYGCLEFGSSKTC